MCPKYSVASAIVALFVFGFLFTSSVSAQSKKAANTKKAVAKKTETHTKDAKKGRDTAKVADRDKKKDKLTAKEKSKAEAQAKKDTKNTKVDPKKAKESKALAAERRRKEEERRQTILAEQRRREQARREAIARRLAFERGLRTETIANISNDKTEGEDLRIRAAAINALGEHAGSVVVMEAQTGKVLTIVNQDWAVRSSIRPCSTIKLVTAAAGLNEGVISKETGAVRNTSTRRDLDDALAYSDNPYFQRAGAQIGNNKLVEYGKKLGLGEQTGINLEGEVPGRLPYSNNNARIYSHGDDTEVTTLQLAVMAAAITNGGHRVLPRIPRNNIEKASFRTFYRANVDLPQQNVRRVIPGMMGAAEYGTARRGVDHSQGIAGKTGSCIDKGSWVGLFASVAPVENPKYAVAVITRGPRARGKYAAAVAGQVYRALSDQIVRTDRNLAQTEFNLRPKYDARTAAKLGETDDEDEVISDEDSTTGGRDMIIVPSVPTQPTTKKLVTKTGDSKPTFPPVVITYDKNGNTQKAPERQRIQ
ncbi:MAG: hypothetical protein IPL32_10565 [Chloracidobacterium sp.]|nr:hypothetical protein [Chloracidobacterium sp.]